MAFLKLANAVVVRNLESWDEWGGESLFHTKLAQQDIVSKYEPDKYLLTHCTIIASVDVEEDVEHYIRPETTRFVNNNYDAWERELLLGCYKTFIGSDNFVEHVQIAALSKGKIIDAVHREVIFPAKTASEREAKSIYVDILVATDRKHTALVKDIEDGRTDKLSMGCAVAFTICSKCGKKAEDEVQLCHHIKYEKGNKFTDENGVERIIAELCGHKDDPESVQFMDASWVSAPAFTGAVLHQIMQPDSSVQAKLKSAFEIQPLIGTESLYLKKVAGTKFFKVSAPEDEVIAPEEEAIEEVETPSEVETSPETAPEEEITEEAVPDDNIADISEEMSFSDVKDIIKKQLKEKAKKEIKEELLRELEEEWMQDPRSEQFLEEGHESEILMSSSTKDQSPEVKVTGKDVNLYTEYDDKIPIELLGYITAKTRRETISKLARAPSKKFVDIYTKNFGSREAAADMHIALKILSLGLDKDAWLRLARSKFSGKGAIILSAFLDGLMHSPFSSKIYTAALNLDKFSHKATYKAYLKRLFGRDLSTAEMKKLAEEVKRLNLFS